MASKASEGDPVLFLEKAFDGRVSQNNSQMTSQNDAILETWPKVKTALPSGRELNYWPVDVSRRVPRNNLIFGVVGKT